MGASAGTACMVLMILACGIRAANAVCTERDQETLDTLLSTVLTDRNIIWGKWLGAALGYGPSLYLMLIIWTLCLITGGLAFDAILLQIVALLIYSGFAAALGQKDIRLTLAAAGTDPGPDPWNQATAR